MKSHKFNHPSIHPSIHALFSRLTCRNLDPALGSFSTLDNNLPWKHLWKPWMPWAHRFKKLQTHLTQLEKNHFSFSISNISIISIHTPSFLLKWFFPHKKQSIQISIRSICGFRCRSWCARFGDTRPSAPPFHPRDSAAPPDAGRTRLPSWQRRPLRRPPSWRWRGGCTKKGCMDLEICWNYIP